MKARVRRFHSPDADLVSFKPPNPASVAVLVQMMVGPEGQEGEESFDVVVCTASWLREYVRVHGPTPGRHHLIVEHWDWQATRDYLVREVEAVTEETWQEVAAKVGRIGKWEFEDYLE